MAKRQKARPRRRDSRPVVVPGRVDPGIQGPIRRSAEFHEHCQYEGTWANGLQDGYGSETYADGGTYQGQWLRGMRHGYGVRSSAPFGLASHYRPNKSLRASLTSLRSNEGGAGAAPGQAPTPDPAEKRNHRVDDSRGGFVLKARSDEPPARRNSLVEKTKKGLLSIRKQRSTGDLEKRGTGGAGGSGSIRSTASSASWMSTESSHSMTNASVHTDSNASFVVEDEQLDGSVTETYMGEWKNDKRTGFGISERSDGLRYEGEWFANKKYGYGVTTFRDGSKEEGKYKNNVLITSQKKKHLFLIRSAKFRERIDAAVNAAQRASKIALQKADIAISRTATARGKGEQADMAADHAKEDSDIAQATAKQFAPDFKPLTERIRLREKFRPPPDGALPGKSILHQQKAPNEHTNQNVPNKPTVSLNLSDRYPSTRRPSEPQLLQTQQTQQQTNADYSISNDISYASQNQSSVSQHNQYNKQDSAMHNEAPYESHNIRDSQQQLMGNSIGPGGHPSSNLRRNSRQVGERPSLVQQSSIDHFDHYKRPPSRDSSVDRYTRAASRLGGVPSRQPSMDRGATSPQDILDRGIRAGSAVRGTTPMPNQMRGTTPLPGNLCNGSVMTGGGGSRGTTPFNNVGSKANSPPPSQPPFEDVLLRKRTLGQDIIPSPGQPKRTESLYISPVKASGGGGGGGAVGKKSLPSQLPLQRKKSLPDVQGLPHAAEAMSREEVSALGSARREEVRRIADENERLRANPLLYLVSPQVKDWFSRQQLVMLVLFINISLAIMFFKLLT
ncbi:junctophilin-1-like isoform X3 [Ctenocephalides felis]|uniref:junctophilin-1-like isoform X3 n=1 Tax=Ctenocephalides felis TaxID=7515 RepID=UPI000E6E57D2|nr:junctophilin-1-like isoform X3 [Ctenocephalides felis]